MPNLVRWVGFTLAFIFGTTSPAHVQVTQSIESELVLITPVGKTLSDHALRDFVLYAKEKWGVNVKASALAVGTPAAYGQILEWNGRPGADIFWGGEGVLFDRLAEQRLLEKLDLPRAIIESIPESIGRPKPIRLKDPNGYWIGTLIEVYGLVYQPKVLQRLGVPEPKDWDDLLHPNLKGQIVQCAPTRSGSSHAAYELILQRDGDENGWQWLKHLAANTGIFTARSRDVSSLVAKGEFAAGFAVPSYMAFEDRLAGFDIKLVVPETAGFTIGTIGVLSGAPHPRTARAFIEFMLSERGQKVAMARGVFPIVPKYHVQGAAGSTAELVVQFVGGIRSYFDHEVKNVYDDDLAQKRYEQIDSQFRTQIEAAWEELKRKY